MRGIDPKGAASVDWPSQNPVAVGAGYRQSSNNPWASDGRIDGAERQLYAGGKMRGRLPSDLTAVQVGMGGAPTQLGLQVREAVPTARNKLVPSSGASQVGGNYHAFLPPPDKFLILNLRKLHPVPAFGRRGTVTRSSIGNPSLQGTRAARGNG